MSLCFIRPNWPAPDSIRALTTTRCGGVSCAPFDNFNLGDHVGDVAGDVATNRQRLIHAAKLPSQPVWLKQVHSTIAIELSPTIPPSNQQVAPTADASFTLSPNVVCCVMTADCIPLLLCAPKTGEIAAVHAGWRGLRDGVIEETVTAMRASGDELMAWIGPSIQQANYEIGEEVRDQFMAVDSQAHLAFKPKTNGKWLGDMVKICAQRLQKLSIPGIYGGQLCTFAQKQQFFSYRRDGQTGRMATLIWRQE